MQQINIFLLNNLNEAIYSKNLLQNKKKIIFLEIVQRLHLSYSNFFVTTHHSKGCIDHSAKAPITNVNAGSFHLGGKIWFKRTLFKDSHATRLSWNLLLSFHKNGLRS